jgi:hypothetical protein
MLTNEEQVRPYAYKHGDKPLDGYTIERAVGRGGFGEVYYALSDSGRQVALKVIQNYEQIELRGIQQCMNLKSPHLVTVFDVKHNADQKPFVVMEYVSGPSLRDLIDESAGGLGEQKSAFFLREIGKGLSFLHECGIVHRDLKPGNIFYENGAVKIGDYGLSKAISTGMHSGQTITVGTVHYMAPEIGKGQYDQSIDIYALGILLYEMLTGQVPFFGASAGEVLMKHLADKVDLDLVPDSFKQVIQKSLAKDPQDRYQSVQKMIEDVFGSEHIRNSVSQFSPESLSIIAERVAQKAKTRQTEQTPKPSPQPKTGQPVNAWSNVGRRAAQVGEQVGQIGEHLGDQVGEIGDKIAERLTGDPKQFHVQEEFRAATTADPIKRRQKRTLCLITMVAVSLGTGVFASHGGDDFIGIGCFSFLMILGASVGMLFARWRWCPRMESHILQNIVVVSVGMIFATIMSMIMWADGPTIPTMKIVLCAMVPLILFNWWRITSPQRRQRVSLGLAIGMAAVGFFVALFLHFDDPAIVMGILAGIALVLQIASPFVPPAVRKQYAGAFTETKRRGNQSVNARKSPTSKILHLKKQQQMPYQPPLYFVPQPVRLFWLISFILFLGTGLMLLFWAGFGRLHREEFAMAVGFGISSLLASLVCLIKSFRSTFTGWYSYLIRPVLMLCCLTSVITAICYLGSANPRGDEVLGCLSLIIFPGIVFLVTVFIPARFFEKSYDAAAQSINTKKKNLVNRTNAMTDQFVNHMSTPKEQLLVSPYKQTPALLLAIIPLVLPFLNGVQRFYVGKIGTGLLWFFTLGFFWIGQLIDVVMIIMGRFTDKHGRSLQMWLSENELKRPISPPAPPMEDTPMNRNQHPTTNQNPSPDRQGGGPASQTPLEQNTSGYPTTNYPSPEPFHPGAALAAFSGYFLLCLSLFFGLIAAVHFPDMIDAGLFGQKVPREITEEIGSGWPALFNQGLMLLAILLGMISLVLLVTARRRHGIWHILRTAMGITGLGFFLTALSEGILVANVTVTGQHFNQVWRLDDGPMFSALVLFAVSVILLAWPPRKPEPTPPVLPDQGG